MDLVIMFRDTYLKVPDRKVYRNVKGWSWKEVATDTFQIDIEGTSGKKIRLLLPRASLKMIEETDGKEVSTSTTAW